MDFSEEMRSDESKNKVKEMEGKGIRHVRFVQAKGPSRRAGQAGRVEYVCIYCVRKRVNCGLDVATVWCGINFRLCILFLK